MVIPVERKYKVRRGDVWPGDVIALKYLGSTAFWTNAVVKSQVRASSNGPVIKEFHFTPVVTSVSGYAILTFTLSMTSTETVALEAPVTLYGDIEVQSDQLPKSTVISYVIDVAADITRP